MPTMPIGGVDMNYVVIGAGGFLGSYLLQALEQQKHHVLATAREISGYTNTEYVTWVACDVANAETTERLMDEMRNSRDWTVLYLAACHHPDVVQQDPKGAWNTNITALSAFINALENVSSFYYPSTDTVYGEGSLEHRFAETDRLAPVNLYGRQKALAEQIVLTYGYHVVRYPFLIGPSLARNKKHFYDMILDTVASGRTMDMFADSYRSALSFRQAAEYLLDLTRMEQETVPPLINVASDDALSKYDIGRQIAISNGLDPQLIRPISIAHAEGIFKAPRASTALLDNTLLKQVLSMDEIHLEL